MLPLADIEAMLSASAQCSTCSQCEQSHDGALGVAAKKGMMSKSQNERVSTSDLNKVTKIHMLLRINKEACFMALVVKRQSIE